MQNGDLPFINTQDNKLPEKLLKPYNPTEEESSIYKTWEESGYFNPDKLVKDGITNANAKSYTIVMPPPNVTGVLHMGHAMMLTVEDILIRYKRMCGYKALWLPGTDHAAIATQSKVEGEIKKKEGKSRHDLGRVEMLKRIEVFAKESHDTIASQVKAMGASCDWSREAFTLDETRTKAVRTMFKKMYDDGLIYRGHRIVNWDPKGQTTISDDEIVYVEEKTKFYYFKYGPFTIGTARPETKFGDKYVVMHPKDERYKEYAHGEKIDLEWINGKVTATIIKDESIDMGFGTGVMTITPWHSNVDFEIAERHNLDKEQIINEVGKLLPIAGEFSGMKIAEARPKIIEKLREKGLLVKEEDYTHNIATAERTGGIVEPQIKLQWFIDVNKPIPGKEKTLKDLMREPVENGEIKIIPDYFGKTYFHWIDNLRDWCISRQIWYGHRIPVWYDKEGKIQLQKEKRIIFVRHGESLSNEKHIYDGQNDSPLTEKGKLQAKNIAKELGGNNIKKIFSSDLSRAKETANIIAEELNVKNISFHSELREVSAGKLQGEEVSKGPILIATLLENTGETTEELFGRAKEAWKIINTTKEDAIAVVGHQSFLCVMKAVIDEIEENKEVLIEYRKKWRISNAGIYELNLAIEPSGGDLKQDEDTLDTWFSSALWTFSTLGWPENTEDLKIYHPTNVLETGYEILFFWVARMIMMSEYALGTIPFHTVYLHGTVRDAQGRKMSKSLGNGIDPIDIANKYGADAGRMALIIGTAPGTDSKISEEKIKGMKHFANKIWNITRFVLTNYNEDNIEYLEEDKKLLEEWQNLAKSVTNDIEDYRFHTASESIYQYIWTRFADEILEESKPILSGENIQQKESRQKLLLEILAGNLKLLHPFMPFVTEAIWEMLPIKNKKDLIMVESWPI